MDLIVCSLLFARRFAQAVVLTKRLYEVLCLSIGCVGLRTAGFGRAIAVGVAESKFAPGTATQPGCVEWVRL